MPGDPRGGIITPVRRFVAKRITGALCLLPTPFGKIDGLRRIMQQRENDVIADRARKEFGFRWNIGNHRSDLQKRERA